MSYNVHALIHIADDVEHYGSSLNGINAFQFENHLRGLKKGVRKAQNPISQVAKRIAGMENYQNVEEHRKKIMCIFLRRKRTVVFF